MRRYFAGTAILAIFIFMNPAWGEAGVMDRVGSFFDAISRGLSEVGRRTEDVIRPSFGPFEDEIVDFTNLVQYPREVRESYPIAREGKVSVANAFGEIQVQTWEQRVVQIEADISVGAESLDVATQLARAIHVGVTQDETGLHIRTNYPSTGDLGRVAMTVNYRLSVPRDIRLSCDNYFGDTLVAGVEGPVDVRAEFGVVDLSDLAGPTSVRARGESVQVRDLEQGGVFDLRGAEAEFHRVGGETRISNFMGTVNVYDLPAEATLDAMSESGSLHLYIAEDASPDILASALFGEIVSDITLDRNVQGDAVVARRANVDAENRVTLHTRFGDVYIHRMGADSESLPQPTEGSTFIKDVISRSLTVTSGTPLAIEAIAGNITVVGVDEDEVQVTATRLVRLRSHDRAEEAAAALQMAFEDAGEGVRIRTSASEDMAAFGCTYYRIDLEVQCPRGSSLRIAGLQGHTAVTDLGGPLEVGQAEGSVLVERVAGKVTLGNNNGDVTAVDCAGPLAIAAQHGAVTAQSIEGRVQVECVSGKTIVDSPRGEVYVRNHGGDVRIIALDGIGGNYDVLAERGNLSILLPESADATLLLTAQDGAVQPSNGVSLTGRIEDGLHFFQGRLNNGLYTLDLKTTEGNIVID
jgi:putative adhesin